MRKINENECIGCGICANICPEGIKMADGKAIIKEESADCLRTAADACPQRCIIIEDEETPDEKTNVSTNNQDYGSGLARGTGRGQGRGFGRGLGRGRGLRK